MKSIVNKNIEKIGIFFKAKCVCGKYTAFANKNSALKMLKRGTCKYCKVNYRSLLSLNENIQIYKKENKWCCRCSDCNTEQCYTRAGHAKQSVIADWKCKKCAQKIKLYSNNYHIGPKQRIYNKFKKSAINRGIKWELNFDDIWSIYKGVCTLTGWELDYTYDSKSSPSLDRIDSSKSYIVHNIQWVHPLVNLCKRNMDNSKFIKMCESIVKYTELNGN